VVALAGLVATGALGRLEHGHGRAPAAASMAIVGRHAVLDDLPPTTSTTVLEVFRAAAVAPPRVWPATGPLTGWFGEDRPGHRHAGLDVDGETGDPVVAAAAGTVAIAGPAPKGYGGYGNIVVIDHGGGVQTVSAHLSRIDVVVGQVVDAGTLVGAIGTSGSVTGSHLHFEVRVGGVAVDPAGWLPARVPTPA
jgi:murein DD-endopeptidase MepM/ murein hydrolase activator NlpD